jgi:hypothetical protein
VTDRAFAFPVVLALCLAAMSRAPAEAQPAPEDARGLQPGARVRVTMANPSQVGGSKLVWVGRLAASDQSELKLAMSSSETRALRRDAIVRLELSVSPSRKTKGALIGFGLGVAATLGKAALQGGCNDGCNSANVLTAALVALSAAGVGAAISPGERWVDVAVARARVTMPPEAGLRVRLVPQIGRQTGLTLVASF